MKTFLSRKEARRLALGSQGLLKKSGFGNGKTGAFKAIEHLGYIQIDTIAVVERAHHHTLWTRCHGYTQKMLDDLQVKDRKIFEYWSHAAAYLPLKDYRYCLPRMNAIAAGERHWFEPDKKLMQRVLERIKQEGPLMAKDFEPPENHKSGVWWDWKPAKQALEQLFIEGKLMVVRRNNFQKVYDLPERVLPTALDTTVPTTEEFCRFLIRQAIQANGLVSETEIGYMRKGLKKSVKNELKKMQSGGEILSANVEGLAEQLYYTSEERLNALKNSRATGTVHILSPFDNAIIQRKRVQQLFDFDYQLECYLPKPKRIYGYFCLPILWGEQFIGRLDPKADRKSQTFYIRNLVFEPTFKKLHHVLQPLADKLVELAAFNGCDKILVQKIDPKSLLSELKRLIK